MQQLKISKISIGRNGKEKDITPSISTTYKFVYVYSGTEQAKAMGHRLNKLNIA